MTIDNQEQQPQSEHRLDDNVWYNARPVALGMGASGTGKDQIVLHLEIDSGHGQWIRMSKYNDISTPAGREITMGDIRAFGCEGFKPSQWIATIKKDAPFSVLLKTSEYQGKWTQKIDKINARKPEYTPEVVAKKDIEFEAMFMAADQARLDYLQGKAAGQAAGGGRGGGRSNALPPEPTNGSERSDFGRGSAKDDNFTDPKTKQDRF